jgi:histidine triad (HIT) family protein
MTDCIFCKIINKEIKANIVSETDYAMAFTDVNPQAPTHILVVPKKHFANVNETEDIELLGKLLKLAGQIATEKQLDSGFRLVINKGLEAGQSVDHLHIHILGGRQMQWPPG